MRCSNESRDEEKEAKGRKNGSRMDAPPRAPPKGVGQRPEARRELVVRSAGCEIGCPKIAGAKEKTNAESAEAQRNT